MMPLGRQHKSQLLGNEENKIIVELNNANIKKITILWMHS